MLVTLPGALSPRSDTHKEEHDMGGPEESRTATGRVVVGGTTHSSAVGIRVFDLVGGRDLGGHEVALVPRAEVTGIEHPTYLATHPSRPVLYAVSETTPGEIVSFRIGSSGDLSEWQRATSVGDGPCHLSTDGVHLVVANYGSGSAAAHRLAADGSFDELVWSTRLDGNGPHVRQDAPHAHFAATDPHDGSVLVVDLGTDRILRFEAGPDGFGPATALAVAPGTGPRHLAFHPHDRVAFAVGELDNTLLALDVDDAGGLSVRQVVSTLPDGFADHSLAAAVRVEPSGRRLFVSNRGHDSIAVVAYEPGDQPLRPLGHVASGGVGPRDIVIDPTGSLLLAANQHSGDITAFDLRSPGLPRPLGLLASVPEPTCILVTGGPT